MRKKPRGRKYRNLVRRGDSIYFERLIGGRRIKRALNTDDWDYAVEVRDSLEGELGVSLVPRIESPTFAEEAEATLATMRRYIKAGSKHRVSTSTARDLSRQLAEDGPIVPHLGEYALDAIDAPALRAWYEREILPRRLSDHTALNYLSAVERVLRHARNRGKLDPTHKPVGVFSEQLRGESRTKAARAAKDEGRRLAKDGVLTPDQVGALYAAAQADGREAEVVVGLALECGLRRGEISALTWGCVHWGSGPDDPARAIEVRQSNSSGLGVEHTKGGKMRRPHLSRRLYLALRQLYKDRWEPGPDARIIKRNYFDLDKLTLRRALKRAGLPRRTFQNLRATCSSLLRQWGVAPEYVRAAIGHEGEQVADKHYTALDFTEYREPERLGQGEVPADLFARLCRAESHQIPTTPKKTAVKSAS